MAGEMEAMGEEKQRNLCKNKGGNRENKGKTKKQISIEIKLSPNLHTIFLSIIPYIGCFTRLGAQLGRWIQFPIKILQIETCGIEIGNEICKIEQFCTLKAEGANT